VVEGGAVPGDPAVDSGRTSDTAARAETGIPGITGVTGATGDTGRVLDDAGSGTPLDTACVDAIVDFDAFALGDVGQWTVPVVDSDGWGVWVVWSEELAYGKRHAVGGRLGCDGSWTFGPDDLAADPDDDHILPTVASGEDGTMFAWTSRYEPGYFTGIDKGVERVVYHPDGTVRTPTVATQATSGGVPQLLGVHSAVARSGGGFAIAGTWEVEDGPSVSRVAIVELDADGALLGDGVEIAPSQDHQWDARVAATEPLSAAWLEVADGPERGWFGVVGSGFGAFLPWAYTAIDAVGSADGAWVVGGGLPGVTLQRPDGTTVVTAGAGSPRIDLGVDTVLVVQHDGTGLVAVGHDLQGTVLQSVALDATVWGGWIAPEWDVTHVGDDVYFVAWIGTDHVAYGQFVDLR
jgi:hypothetical protein